MLAKLIPLLTVLNTFSAGSLHGPISRRIVRGFGVDIKLFPHAVFLYFEVKRPSTCGASLITRQAVVTSAHCMGELSVYKGSVHAYLGATVPMYSKVVRNVTSYIIHPHYNQYSGKFDLSVAMFDSEVPMIHGIHPIRIYKESLKINDVMFTAGWGKKWPNVVPDFSDARSLDASKQRLVSSVECYNSSGVKVTQALMCSLPVVGLHYRGDLGNGLVTTKPIMKLVGVVSFMVKDATIYAKLVTQRNWLRDSLIKLNGNTAVGIECC